MLLCYIDKKIKFAIIDLIESDILINNGLVFPIGEFCMGSISKNKMTNMIVAEKVADHDGEEMMVIL
jgi:hypothetical protein